MYHKAIQQFARTLRQLDGVLEKAEAHARARGWDSSHFLTSKLAPDMFSLVRQVRIGCDHAKFTAAALSGTDAPKHEDNEQSVPELRARIEKCVAYLEGFKEADFAKTKGDQVIKMPNRPGKGMKADEYLWIRQIPNFFFHVTTAYDIIRAAGVEIGKTDFIGKTDIQDL
ncbi:MAG TPA: DUF1993 domain-containing protein [Polyangia bacterium]|nr:DUF1993 domain-containing protein [Polyangia bacterium]